MKRILRRITLGVSLLGIGIGAGAVVLNPSPAITSGDVEHIDEERNCLSGCDTETDICCSSTEEE